MAGEVPITVVGNLTADPELRYTQGGLPVVNFTVASTPRLLKDGEWKDGEATFWRCSAWREFAEHIAQSLSKGSRVIVNGFVSMRAYETAEGEKRTATQIDVQAVGPDLRYATAIVERAAGKGPAKTTDWAAAQPGSARATAHVAGDGSWAVSDAVGQQTYGEDTPF